MDPESTQEIGVPVPYAAWLAADRAYDNPDHECQGDELHQALAAASPHIRIEELDEHLRALTVELSHVKLFGRHATGVRAGIDFAIQLLADRKRALQRAAQGGAPQ